MIVLVTTLGAMNGIPLGTYDGSEIGSLESLTNGTSNGKFDGLLLGSRLGLVDGLKMVTDKVTELGF